MSDEAEKIERGLKKIQNNTVALMRLRRAAFCAEQLKLLGDVQGDLLKTEMFLALQDSLVVSYASCFSSSGEGRATYTPSQIFKDKTDLEEVHKIIMRMRQEICAHNGNDPRLEDGIVKNEFVDRIEISFRVKITLPSVSDINRMLKNIDAVYNHLHENIKKTANKLSSEIGRKVIISDAIGQVDKS